jgi:ribosomal protein S27AE
MEDSLPHAARSAAAPETGLCAVCQCAIAPGEETHKCAGCGTNYHAECWTYNNGCGVYGCSFAAPTESLTSLEIPAGHWGREDKDCPRCGRSILAAAMRCKHCGATFTSAAPQASSTFRQQEQVKSSLPAVRRTAIILLVFAIIPFTAPFAAVIGGIWLAVQWRAIRSLPPVVGAMGKIAVGVALLQTLLLIGAGALNTFLLQR